MEIKLNVLLAKTDHLGASFRKMTEDYVKFFKSKQSEFRGEKKTYNPREGTIDVPSYRKNELVVTTVDEKLDWIEETSADYIDALFSQEATNASGLAKAELLVDGISFGKLSSLELLRLKTIIETGTFDEMYKTIPVRNDDELWKESTDEMYEDRSIYESELQRGENKSTTKDQYILPDPNIQFVKDGTYTPQVASKDTIIVLGDYTYQKFTGEWSHRQRADLLKRKTKLLTAIIEALKRSNEVEAISSEITAKKLFGYLHRGKL